MKESTSKLAKGSLILLLSTAIAKIISAIFKIPLASDTFLGEVGFGYFSVAADIYTPFYILAISGLPVAVSHKVSKIASDKSRSDAFNTFKSFRKLFVIMGALCSLLFIAVLTVLCFAFSTQKNAFICVFAVVPSIFLCFLISAYRGLFEGYSNMNPTAVSKVIEAFVKCAFGLLFAFITVRATGNIPLAAAMSAFAMSIATAFSLLYLYIKTKFNFSKVTESKKVDISLKYVFRVSLPFVIAGLTASFVSLLDVVAVKIPLDLFGNSYFGNIINTLNVDITEISAYLYGVRSKAFTIYNLIPTLSVSLGVAALPVLTSLNAQNKITAVKENINYTLKLIFSVCLPAAIGIIVLSGRIMPLLYSSTDVLSGNLLLIYGVTALFSGFAIPAITLLLALEKQRSTIINVIVCIFIKFFVSIILVQFSAVNIYSAPIGTLAAYIYLALSTFILLYKTVGKPDIINSFIKPLFAALCSGVSAFVISKFSSRDTVTFIAILVAVIIYCAVILITKTFTIHEIKNIAQFNNKVQ